MTRFGTHGPERWWHVMGGSPDLNGDGNPRLGQLDHQRVEGVEPQRRVVASNAMTANE